MPDRFAVGQVRPASARFLSRTRGGVACRRPRNGRANPDAPRRRVDAPPRGIRRTSPQATRPPARHAARPHLHGTAATRRKLAPPQRGKSWHRRDAASVGTAATRQERAPLQPGKGTSRQRGDPARSPPQGPGPPPACWRQADRPIPPQARQTAGRKAPEVNGEAAVANGSPGSRRRSLPARPMTSPRGRPHRAPEPPPGCRHRTPDPPHWPVPLARLIAPPHQPVPPAPRPRRRRHHGPAARLLSCRNTPGCGGWPPLRRHPPPSHRAATAPRFGLTSSRNPGRVPAARRW